MGFFDDNRAQLLKLQEIVSYGKVNAEGRGGERHLSSVLPAATAALGTPVQTAIHKDPEELRAALNMPHAESVIVVLIDGMGFWNVVDRKGHAPYLRSLLQREGNDKPISSCTPSTTVAAMGVFGTGTCPGLTAMTGYSQLNPKRREISQMIKFTGDLDPLEIQTQPTIFEQLSNRGVRVTSVGLPQFEHSSLTTAALRGSTYIAGENPTKRVNLAAKASYTPGLTYLYIRDADKMGHQYGWHDQHWIGTFERVDAQLKMLASKAAPGTLIIITADHGMINSNPATRIDIAEHTPLNEDIELIGGEPRAVSAYLTPGKDARTVSERWQNYLGDAARIYTKDEAVESGIYGVVSDYTYTVLGDVIAFASDDVTLVDSRTQKDMATRLPSVHGSMTAAELDIPLFMDVVR